MVILLIGCSSARFDINKVDFSYENQPQKVLPLKYYNQSNLKPETAEKIMKNFSALDGEEFWGHYYIHYDVDKQEEGFFLFDLGLTGFIDGILVFALSLVGVPKARLHYNLTATVYLFDSDGNITGTYEESSVVTKYKGLYYGYSVPVKEIANKYKIMFKEIVSEAGLDSERVNNQLELSGTLQEERTAEVYTNIYRLVK